LDIIAFDHPHALWLLLLAVPIVWLGRRTLVTLDPVRRWAAIGLRLAVLTLLVLMLAGLQAVRTHDDLTVISMVDRSESVRRFADPPPIGEDASGAEQGGDDVARWVERYFQAGSEPQDGDRFGWIGYDGRPTVQRMPGEGVRLESGTIDQPLSGTDTASAIRTSMALFPPDTGARLVLVSDGNDTGGGQNPGESGTSEVMAAVREAKAAGIPIDVVPLSYQAEREVMVESVHAPNEAREGETVSVRVVLRATEPTAGRLQLLHDGEALDLNADRSGKGSRVPMEAWTREARQTVGSGDAPDAGAEAVGEYVAVQSIELPLRYSGVNQFEAVFEPEQSPADRIAVNNAARGFTLVHGQGRVLFVSNVEGQQGQLLPQTLRKAGIELEVVPPSGLPVEMARLQRYDAVVLQNVPAEQVTVPQQRMLAKYVNDLGGGLVKIGGPEAFGAGGWNNTPVARVLPVETEIPSQKVLPSGALVLVLDRSGSMSASVGGRTKQQVANEAAIQALQTLYPQDLVGVVAFDNSAKQVVQLQMNEDPTAVADAVRSIQPGGGTNIYSGLDMAYRELAPLETQEAAIKHVVLLTDGHSREGNYLELVGNMMKSDITLSTVGVGDTPNNSLLQRLAQMGGGRYHDVTDPDNLPQIFIKEARTIRRNLIKEETFSPTVYSGRSPIVSGLGGVPELHGLVLTGRRDDPRVFMPIVGPEGEPVFAHWQAGLGRVAAFTSDATTRWASNWVQWGGYGDFWASVMRRISRPSRSREADLTTAVRDGELRLRLDASGLEEDAFADFLSVDGSVLKPDGSTEPVELQQTGPGVYETTASAPEAGNYVVTLLAEDEDGQQQAVFGGATKNRGQELRRFASSDGLLRRIAEETGGRLLDPGDPQQASIFTRDRDFQTRSIRPLWWTLGVLGIVLLLLDVAGRRIAWEPAAVRAWSREKARALAGVMRPRPVESERTLGALKDRRQQTQQQSPSEPAAASADESHGPARPAANQKFDAARAEPSSEDLASAVGAAGDTSRQATTDHQAPQASTEQSEAAGSTSSRLHAAKQRTRKRMGGE
jgi:uncharacterized membrane protein